jgi:hypothetical protein
MRQLRIGLLVTALALGGLFSAAYLHAQQTTNTCPPGTAATTAPAVTTTTTAAATTTTPAMLPQVSARTTTVSGREVGEVLIGDRVAMQLTEPVGGFTPGERAQIVATRIMNALSQGYTATDVRTARIGAQTAVYMGNELLVTADPRAASLAGTTASALAGTWSTNLQAALRTTPTTVVAGSVESWPAWTNASTKIVPILSAGTPGVSLGFAQVTGPAERISNVRAVFQVDLEFQNTARIYAFVPSSSLTGLSRVQGTAVTALLQYTVFNF